MNNFTYALAAFILLHVGVSATGLRALIVEKIGERTYRGVFSLVSIALLAWLTFAFGHMRSNPFDPLNQALWAVPPWGRHAAQGLVLIGFLFAFAGILTPGPTSIPGEGRPLAEDTPAKGMLRITRHPFLWGVVIWAAGHLLANGERFAPMLFGGLGLMALLGARSIDRKAAARDPEGWARFASVTSNIPFAAIVTGRNSFVFSETWLRLMIALAVFLAFALLHPYLIGVPAVP
ncbi:MAG: NnrU family protein [Caulobacterales bacterium]